MNGKKIHQNWPSDGVEPVSSCPICGEKEKHLIHEGLSDRIFFSAPGKWSMYRCESCRSAYLDPRPTLETLHIAYENYYTHEEELNFSSLSLFRKLRRIVVNGYSNYRYGTRIYPASVLGAIVAILMPDQRAIIDARMRHLSKAKTGNRLLDVGCGNGEFLKRAQSAGWDVVGVDFDSIAVETACSQNLDVRLGDVGVLDPSIEQFDVITLSHVIEHVHDPLDLLETSFKLLKPGGNVWIDTPNIEAYGHKLYGESWRGLEPPRHLMIFTLAAMNKILHTAGFGTVEVQPYRPVCSNMFQASQAIVDRRGAIKNMYKNVSPGVVRNGERIAKLDPNCREFITVKAWKD